MLQLQIAQMVSATQAEGPGTRFAIWFQGCPLRCPGCCNPEMLSFQGGQAFDIESIVQQIQNAKTENKIEGITLLGGEPFAQAKAAAELAKCVRNLNLTVMIFSGHLLEELQASKEHGVAELLSRTDILVDGPYDRERPDSTRRWIGSSNQQIHFLSDRYSQHDPCWTETDTLEIRLVNNQLTVNGFPAKSATGIWKKPR